MKNVGSSERIARAIAIVPLALCAVLAPFPLAARLAMFAMPALVLLWTVATCSCSINRLLGRSSCAVNPR